MPRKIKVTAEQIYDARGRWWAEYVRCRQFVRALPDARRSVLLGRVLDLPRPFLHFAYGGPMWLSEVHGMGTPSAPGASFRLAIESGLDVDCLIWWFWSDEGWQALEDLWAKLPEVVHIPLCTSRGLFPNCTHIEYVFSDSGGQ